MTDDVCTCGHEEHLHGTCTDPRSTRCTVCTCDEFEWDIDREAAPQGGKGGDSGE